MPHPNGSISVAYSNSKKGLEAEINLPDGVSGTFVWEGKSYPLKAGENTLGL
ncbi:hypothetical protein [Mangrovibacterium lignilyticum]|uniref:hypothetical protein n=1 Tax=Mangrovibacterium lignilyticum TaxID=2668052 RepID=UPI0013D5AEC7|nr:hypothetical protein [Mangrovibacterium lignilyticum]